jgi:hypothetical protein
MNRVNFKRAVRLAREGRDFRKLVDKYGCTRAQWKALVRLNAQNGRR